MPKHAPKNTPLFPQADPNIAKAKWEEPLLPDGSTVGVALNRGGLTGGRNAENRTTQGETIPDPTFPAPIQDSDFGGNGDFTKSTGRTFDK